MSAAAATSQPPQLRPTDNDLCILSLAVQRIPAVDSCSQQECMSLLPCSCCSSRCLTLTDVPLRCSPAHPEHAADASCASDAMIPSAAIPRFLQRLRPEACAVVLPLNSPKLKCTPAAAGTADLTRKSTSLDTIPATPVPVAAAASAIASPQSHWSVSGLAPSLLLCHGLSAARSFRRSLLAALPLL